MKSLKYVITIINSVRGRLTIVGRKNIQEEFVLNQRNHLSKSLCEFLKSTEIMSVI